MASREVFSFSTKNNDFDIGITSRSVVTRIEFIGHLIVLRVALAVTIQRNNGDALIAWLMNSVRDRFKGVDVNVHVVGEQGLEP